jgi:hypothetical protein
MSIKNEFVDINLENPQSSMSIFKFFKQIIVVNGFEVENGVLGLESDIYLSIVKFLNLSILRKNKSKYFYFIQFSIYILDKVGEVKFNFDGICFFLFPM